jgi:DNA topoisomerase I
VTAVLTSEPGPGPPGSSRRRRRIRTPEAVLVFGTDAEPGIRRHGRTRFRYVDDVTGRTVTDEATLARIRRLAVPPAWTEVWIAREPDAHLQATGRDGRGRKQYRYHPAFRSHREAHKFDQLPAFGTVLGSLRARVAADLQRDGLDRDRVVAIVVRLLDHTFVRVGNEEYARANQSYGLTTLRDDHAEIHGGRLQLTFTGKHGAQHDVRVDDRRLARLVRRCQDLPGQVLLQYVEGNEVRPVRSTDVNDYLRDATGLDVTAKTFRTWAASVLMGAGLAEVEVPPSVRAREMVVAAAVKVVAGELHNTPAVCRRSYIHPRIPTAFLDGTFPEQWAAGPARPAGGLSVPERRLVSFLS